MDCVRASKIAQHVSSIRQVRGVSDVQSDISFVLLFVVFEIIILQQMQGEPNPLLIAI